MKGYDRLYREIQRIDCDLRKNYGNGITILEKIIHLENEYILEHKNLTIQEQNSMKNLIDILDSNLNNRMKYIELKKIRELLEKEQEK